MRILFTLFTALYSLSGICQTWQPIANLPSGRHHPVGWGIDGKGYVVTGTNSFGNPTNDFYEYDPVADTWTTLTSFPGSSRSFAIGAVYEGKGYMGFGSGTFADFNDLWRYDPSIDQWVQLASCPCSGRRHPAFIPLNDKIYVGLGDDLISGNLNDWWVYDMIADSWTQLPNLPGNPRHHPYQFNAGNLVFTGMGHGGPIIYKDWYQFDPVSNTWTVMADFPGEARVAGTQFDYDGFGFVLSGDGDNHSTMPTGEMWRYNHTNDTWLQFPPHPGVSRWAPGSLVIEDVVYFFGGTNRQTSQNPVEAFKFDLAQASVGINENRLESFAFYPNPTQEMIRWSSEVAVENIEILNALGSKVFEGRIEGNQLNVSFLKQGVYLIEVHLLDGRRQSARMIVQ